jgi:hypothetical protein
MMIWVSSCSCPIGLDAVISVYPSCLLRVRYFRVAPFRAFGKQFCPKEAAKESKMDPMTEGKEKDYRYSVEDPPVP